MLGLFANIFLERGMMKTFEFSMKEKQKENLIAGLNVLRARVIIKNTRRFNRFCSKFDLSMEEAEKLMLGTIEHFKKEIKGGENNVKKEKRHSA
jgi:hypothetical protein